MSERAVVVMGKIPRAGRVKTRLSPPLSPETAALLYAAFLGDVFDVVEAAEPLIPGGFERVFSVALETDEDAASAETLVPSTAWRLQFQRGLDLGERMAFAYEDAAAFHTVIIGSDSPTMPPFRIAEAFRGLEGGASAVFGPTEDGGYDLIALPRIERALLSAMPWSTDQVMAETRRRALSAGLGILELPLGADIDGVEDLPRALREAERPGSLAVRTRRAIAALDRSASKR